jgi:hypothetical protein
LVINPRVSFGVAHATTANTTGLIRGVFAGIFGALSTRNDPMTADFETFTREKIARLRAEAEALEKSLKEYQAAMARAAGPARRGSNDGSAFSVVMEAIAAAGAEGLTLDGMIEAAKEKGHDVKRNTLRSQIWQAKQDERVEQMEAGRYRIPGAPSSAPAEPAPSYVARARPTVTAADDFPLDDEIPF